MHVLAKRATQVDVIAVSILTQALQDIRVERVGYEGEIKEPVMADAWVRISSKGARTLEAIKKKRTMNIWGGTYNVIYIRYYILRKDKPSSNTRIGTLTSAISSSYHCLLRAGELISRLASIIGRNDSLY